MARKKSALTEKQDIFINAVLDGKNQSRAADEAGYASPNGGHQAMQNEDVQMALQIARAEISDVMQLRRMDMVETILDAIAMARTMADPANMISGAREISKMLGFYEPEKKIIHVTRSQAAIQQCYESLTDQELLEIIEGESTRVEA